MLALVRGERPRFKPSCLDAIASKTSTPTPGQARNSDVLLVQCYWEKNTPACRQRRLLFHYLYRRKAGIG